MATVKERLITKLNAMYFIQEVYPPKEELMKYFELTPKDFIDIINDSQSALEARGLPPYEDLPNLKPLEKTAPQGAVGKKRSELEELDPMFVMAVELILDIGDKRSKAQKLKDLGMTTKRFEALRVQKKHEKYFKDRLAQIWPNVEDSAKIALMKNVESGDLQSIKYWAEWSGAYRPNQDLLLNTTILIGRVMEILVKHVDPKILADVAAELDNVINVTGRELESGSN